MRFGTKVWVKRGSENTIPGTPGCLRKVPGVLVGARGTERWVRLTQSDRFDTAGWWQCGVVGHWSASAVTAR